MKIYIAAPSELQVEARALRTQIEADASFVVHSSWLDLDFPSEILKGQAVMQNHADMDLAEIDSCDLVVAINPPEFHSKGTGGRHVELGWALKGKKRIIVIGVKSNIFHDHRQVRVVEDEMALGIELTHMMEVTNDKRRDA